jgi:hypothetical protein
VLAGEAPGRLSVTDENAPSGVGGHPDSAPLRTG